jgi:hypothetical protein
MRNKINKLSKVVFGLSILLATSCQQEEIVAPTLEDEEAVNLSADDAQVSRVGLAQLLARAVENPHVRQLIKEEAAKQFDRDYDVLLTLVKDQPLASGETLFDYLVSIEGSAERVSGWLSDWKLATIYVPVFDHLDFSAEQWDVSSVVPSVALYLQDSVMSVYDPAGNVTEQSAYEWPDQAMLVLKDWERGTVATGASNGRQNQQLVVGQVDGNVIALSDEAFVPEESLSSARSVLPYTISNEITDIDPKLKNAFKHYQTNQRDHIYYNLPDGPQSGLLNGAGEYYEEALVGIAFDDFKYAWADGNFEFHIIISYLNENTSGSIKKVASVNRGNLFSYKEWGDDDVYATPEVWSPDRPITIMPWDLQTHGDTWHIQLLEYNPSSAPVHKTVSFQTTLGTNFVTEWVEIAPFFEVERTKKVGWHFNGSATQARTVTTSYQSTEKSFDWGQALIRFNDPVVTSKEKVSRFSDKNKYTTHATKTSHKEKAHLYFMPVK